MDIIFAASLGIRRFAIAQCLNSLEPRNPEHNYSFFSGNESLRDEMRSRWPDSAEVQIKGKADMQKKLRDAAHLVLMWDGEGLTDVLFEARYEKIPTKLFSCKVTRIVNKKLTDKYDLYIGRGSLWGNPFVISRDDGPDRMEVIEQYKSYFLQKLATDPAFKRGVLGLRGLRLACHCKPDACHGDVIAEYLDGPDSVSD
ncbi:DUF4326 domain-containing protein [Paucibacter sp. TC2R-5]|uniref:DUF4326 domain-containing protein n=1 Tax=Paucibacter sp. TC2R-5 TaxID=2893555 RepID=UPI0021E3C9C2|nr:DUF4326 domain-containing protein [Paucibacter sp. TC2R-5]MCV2358080.1 DUF4326 domain-containing protein [Paucibacter sp. TC2R-5]